MSGEDKLNEAIKRVQFDVPKWVFSVGVALFGLGLAGFVVALFVDADGAWRAYLSNYTFWVGLAFGGVMWSVVMRITNAHWGRPVMRLAEGMGFFLPVGFLLFLVLLVAAWVSHLYPWAHHAVPLKETWLDAGSIIGREVVYMVILFGFTLLYLRQSLKADVRPLHESRHAPAFFQRLFAKADGSEEEWERSQRTLTRMSPPLAIAYAVLMSLFAFDMVMSLEPYWYSTMFGGFIFIGNMYIGLAALGIIAGLVRERGLLGGYVTKYQFWDIGKLLFAFSMLWTYLMWSQYLPIWYGNLHEEAGYVLKRTAGPYRDWAFLLLGLIWVIPWWLLLPKNNKQRPLILGIAALFPIVGIWLERWTLVALSPIETAPVPVEQVIYPGWMDLSAALMMGGLFVLSYRFFLKSVPILPVGDPIFQEMVDHEPGHHLHHVMDDRMVSVEGGQDPLRD